MEDCTKYALEIFKLTLMNEPINDRLNSELYDKYQYSSSVREDLDAICASFNIKIYNYTGSGLYATPGIDNKVFGYSNAELRDNLGINDNKDLSVCYFIIYSVLSLFYKEASLRCYRDYISVKDVVEECKKNIAAVKDYLPSANKDDRNEGSLSTDKITLQSFESIINAWEDLPDYNQKSKSCSIDEDYKSKTKVSYINKVLRFLENERLLKKDNLQKIYLPSERLVCVVGNFYDELEARNVIVELLEKSKKDIEPQDENN